MFVMIQIEFDLKFGQSHKSNSLPNLQKSEIRQEFHKPALTVPAVAEDQLIYQRSTWLEDRWPQGGGGRQKQTVAFSFARLPWW